MQQIRRVKGFPEWSPGERLVEQTLITRIRRVFEDWGFRGIETRAVEPVDVLLAKGETDQEIFAVGRLQDNAPLSQAALGLHYDLTVPFARYVTEQQGALKFPFRRYQIQKVWRGERPQKGRYREFYQADADIVARDELPAAVDGEMIALLAAATGVLPLGSVTLRLGSRKITDAYMRAIGVDKVEDTVRVLDKLDKIGPEATAQLLTDDIGLAGDLAARCLDFAAISGQPEKALDGIRALDVTEPLLDDGLTQLQTVVDIARVLGATRLECDFGIMRGFNYYTGTIVEGIADDAPTLGSICAGGRYDNLTTASATKFPGMGISIGLSRVMAHLTDTARATPSRETPTCVLVILGNEHDRLEALKTTQQLRARGIPCELYPTPRKVDKQIQYAASIGIPFAWFPKTISTSGHDAVRDLRTGEQANADPSKWLPDFAGDLRPHIHA